ncbi:MAG: sugar ABC transporter ATP-binding protein [Spirochaetes bacterium]|nr:sugar ABC transporter ATP-binding protein [Spirochaetota bacterium]
MKNIKKSFGNNQVLKGVDLSLKAGEIHCLIGENGAGKSTLMNILFGMEAIHSTGGFQGEVRIDGKKVNINSPKEALEANIGMVHQEFMLIPAFSITENVKLNREITKDNLVSKITRVKRLKTVNFKEMHADTRNAMDKLNLNVEEYVKVAGLPVGHMQIVEIAREIDKSHLEILVFDEPTAVLAESEADNLLKTMKKLADEGIAILFITHRLDEVMEVSDRVTVLKDGELVTCKKTSDTSVDEIAELMVGREIHITQKAKKTSQKDEIILDLKDFHVDMPGEEVKGIDLQVHRGEILGLAGLAGQGKIGVANGIMGLFQSAGQVQLHGKLVELNNTGAMLANGLAFVSEDRRGVGLILDESIEMNIAFTALKVQNKFLKKFGFLNIQDTFNITKHAKKMIEGFDIRCTGPHQNAGRLSGGNQQKVCVARALTQDPEILFVSEPTRGIDIGAKKLVLDLLVKLNTEMGMTIVITSSELAEVRSIADRVAIITEGKVAGILPPDAPDKDYGLMMSGMTEEIIEKSGD